MEKTLAFTPEILAYTRRMSSRAGDPLLAEIRRTTETRYPEEARMLVTEEQGNFLSLLVSALGVESAIEIGTFTGYSATCIGRGLGPNGRLLCCDANSQWGDVARGFWQQAGLADRIELRVGPAVNTLRALEPGRTFEFAFIDADKPSYDIYYELVLPRLRRGSLVVFDNMLSGGGVVNPTDERTRALDALNRKLAQDPRVESVLLPLADGLNFCRKL